MSELFQTRHLKLRDITIITMKTTTILFVLILCALFYNSKQQVEDKCFSCDLGTKKSFCNTRYYPDKEEIDACDEIDGDLCRWHGGSYSIFCEVEGLPKGVYCNKTANPCPINRTGKSSPLHSVLILASVVVAGVAVLRF